MVPSAGDLINRAIFTKLSGARDEYGEVQRDTYQEIARRQCQLSELNYKNSDIAKGFSSVVSFELLLHYMPELDTNCQATIAGTVYFVKGIIHDPQPRKAWTKAYLSTIQA